LRNARELDAAHLTLDKNLKQSKGLDKFSTDSTKAAVSGTKTARTLKDLSTSTKKVEDDSGKASRKIRGMASEMDAAKKSGSGLFSMLKQGFTMGSGGVFGGSGGIIPGLANISQIIQGIPAVGQLAHAIITPLLQGAEEGIRLNMVLETTEIAFTQVAGSADKAHAHIMKLQQFGAQSPFRFEGLLKGAQLMNAFGFGLEEQIPKLTIWGNAIAASGEISEESIHRVITAFGQMRMSGKVNAQDMMQLTNANLPGWQLLAKAIGKTVAETRKLAEQGKLNGKVAVEAITEMMRIDPRFQGMMDKLQTTAQGRLSALQDTVQIAQGTATKGLTDNLSKTMGDVLGRQDVVGQLAGVINSALTPASQLIELGVRTILAPGITSGLAEAISAGKSYVADAMIDMAKDSIIGSVKDTLGIQSPSRVFFEMGSDSIIGYRDGAIAQLMEARGTLIGGFDNMLDELEGHLNSRQRRFLASQENAKKNLEELAKREPGFMEKLISGSRARGINPDHLLNVMAVETSGTFDPSIKNPNSSASGLIQFMRDTAKALGTTTEALRKMSATQQLDYVFKYFDQKQYAGKLSTQGAVYAAVGAGHVGAGDDSVLMRRGDRGYEGNKATWDRNLDGIIRQGEMAQAAIVKLGAGITFTVNGTPIGFGNPMPVTWGGDISGGASSAMAPMGRPEMGIGIMGAGAGNVTVTAGLLTANLPTAKEWAVMSSKTLLNFHEIKPLIDESSLYAKDLADETKRGADEAHRGAGEWRDAVMAVGSLQQKLAEFNDTLPKTGEMMTDIFISIPARFGDVVGDAVNKADGTITGFFSDLREGFLGTVKGMLADIARTSITKGIGSLFTAAVGTPEMDPNTGEPTGGVKGGVGWIRSILSVFGIGSTSKNDAVGASATTANTSATLANTVAVTNLTATMAAGAAVGGATGGKGLLGTVLGIALGALGGAAGGGGGATAGANPGSFVPGGYPLVGTGLGLFAEGGHVTAGKPIIVGDHPTGRPNPEIFVPQTAGNVVPLNKLGGGETHVHIHQLIQAPQGKIAPESAEQAAMKSVGAVSRYFEQRGRNV